MFRERQTMVLSASAVNDTEIDLYWSAPMGLRAVKPLRYELQWTPGDGEAWREIELLDDGQWFNHRHSGLWAGKRYSYRIRAHFAGAGVSKWSDEVHVLTEGAGVIPMLRRLRRKLGI